MNGRLTGYSYTDTIIAPCSGLIFGLHLFHPLRRGVNPLLDYWGYSTLAWWSTVPIDKRNSKHTTHDNVASGARDSGRVIHPAINVTARFTRGTLITVLRHGVSVDCVYDLPVHGRRVL